MKVEKYMDKKSKCKLFNVKINDALREAIRLDAFKNDMSMSEAVRRVLEAYYNINGNE